LSDRDRQPGPVIIGAGITGLALGSTSGWPIFEAADGPGGLCRTYYMRPGDLEATTDPGGAGGTYRFEVGGGHWIFGGEARALDFLGRFATFRKYKRRASVLLGQLGLTVDYPLQGHIDSLGAEMATAIRAEMSVRPSADHPSNLREWLEGSFGPTLYGMFFGPFHDRYTAGLTQDIAAQDTYKSPRGPSGGYNVEFRYPVGGLGRMVDRIAGECDVRFGKEVVAIDHHDRRLFFSDGASLPYERVLSTLPLSRAVALAGLDLSVPTDPYTSVLVLNIGARRAPECPQIHWQYEPDSRSGFHRIGFYSNVEEDFLPFGRDPSRVSLYVERAFRGGGPPPFGTDEYCTSVVAELQDRGYIGEVEAIHPSWVEMAYTWSRPGSTWRDEAIQALAQVGVQQAGRYGRWHFQGIAESVGEGLDLGPSQPR
jgi:protoporphyrinogen oxidase